MSNYANKSFRCLREDQNFIETKAKEIFRMELVNTEVNYDFVEMEFRINLDESKINSKLFSNFSKYENLYKELAITKGRVWFF